MSCVSIRGGRYPGALLYIIYTLYCAVEEGFVYDTHR